MIIRFLFSPIVNKYGTMAKSVSCFSRFHAWWIVLFMIFSKVKMKTFPKVESKSCLHVWVLLSGWLTIFFKSCIMVREKMSMGGMVTGLQLCEKEPYLLQWKFFSNTHFCKHYGIGFFQIIFWLVTFWIFCCLSSHYLI